MAYGHLNAIFFGGLLFALDVWGSDQMALRNVAGFFFFLVWLCVVVQGYHLFMQSGCDWGGNASNVQ